jgi:hypothetical protein
MVMAGAVFTHLHVQMMMKFARPPSVTPPTPPPFSLSILSLSLSLSRLAPLCIKAHLADSHTDADSSTFCSFLPTPHPLYRQFHLATTTFQ